jgi:hypothetical protein
MKAPRAHPKPETVHADWWRRPRLSGTTRGSSKGDPRADAGGRIALCRGRPRSDEVSEVRRYATTEKNTLRTCVPDRRSELLGVYRELPPRVGKCGAECAETKGSHSLKNES